MFASTHPGRKIKQGPFEIQKKAQHWSKTFPLTYVLLPSVLNRWE